MPPIPNYLIEERPWGKFERFTLNEPSTVKIITVNPGESFSLQKHAQRDELWKIFSGNGLLTIGETKTDIKGGEIYFVSRGTQHRVEAGSASVIILEIATGNFDEEDIKRLEDKYGRT